MNLAAAFGSLIGAGAATLTSVRLGQKDYASANIILGNVVTMNTILGISFTIIGLIFLDPILLFFGASPHTLPYAHDFMTIILLGNVVTHMFLGLNALLRSSGYPQRSMYATIGTVLINICLNPLFIFVLHFGIKGSALATVISQFIMLCWQIRIFSNKKNFIHFQKGTFKLRKKLVIDTLSIGMSPFLMNLASCLIVILVNQGLKKFGGDLAIGAFGIVNRIIFIFVMIVFGFNQGMQPIAGYNFGAKLYPRVTNVLKITIICATVVTTCGFLLGEFIPHLVASIFTTDDELIPGGEWNENCYDNIPYNRLSDGDSQFLSKHRHGQKVYIPFTHKTDDLLDSRIINLATFLRVRWNMDKYACWRRGCNYHFWNHAVYTIP
jgi:putative MATE family efflux protein